MEILNAGELYELSTGNNKTVHSGESLSEALARAADGGQLELYMQTISESEIKELTEKGYDVSFDMYYLNDELYEVRVYWGIRASGKCNNAVLEFQNLMKAGMIDYFDYEDELTGTQFMKEWNREYGGRPFTGDKTIYIGIHGEPGNFYTDIEDFYEMPNGSDVSRLVDRIKSGKAVIHESV